MKNFFKTTTIILALIISLPGMAQEEKKEKSSGYEFTEVIRLDNTPVKNQYRSGTCWSYASLAFLESELLKAGKGEYDLSEAFIIRNAYQHKADLYIRWHGNINFGGGGAFHDVLEVIREIGMVPESAYTGLVDGEDYFVHGEMDEVFTMYMKGVAENKNRKLSKVWPIGFEGLLDAYLGEYPETFTYEGAEYTPQTFAASLDLNVDDYVEMGSYTHHPFYEEFILEVPDNWMFHEIYNVPLDDMIAVIDNSLEEGHTIGWGADVSEKGFSWSNGIAIVPDADKTDLSGTEKEKWEKLTKKEKSKSLYSFDEPCDEKEITQELRQTGFDNYTTTDDHGLEIVGMANDQNGTKYYIVKNSWGTEGHIYDGYFYASEAFVRYKTIDIIVNKKTVPKKIAKKLEL